MSRLLLKRPYEIRDDLRFLEEMNLLTRHHLQYCEQYSRIWPDWKEAASVEEIPFLHVGIFKHLTLKTNKHDVKHQRVLKSSATTSGLPSMIALDVKSSKLQSESSTRILTDFLGAEKRILLVMDSVKSLRARGEMSARIAAAMSIRPFSTEIVFLLEDADNLDSLKWKALENALDKSNDFILYGFPWIIWLTWAAGKMPVNIKEKLKDKRFSFVHSGGWKKMEALKVAREKFESSLLETVRPSSKVVDFYGLVEQVGVIYPLCEFDFRHVPVWADVLVRDTYSLESIEEKAGQLQFLYPLAYGAPYHSILTEDLGQIVKGQCKCGRKGKKWRLIGRMPDTEIRGCANV